MKIINGIKFTSDNVEWQPGMVLFWDIGSVGEINITSEATSQFYEFGDGTWDVTRLNNEPFGRASALYGRFSTYEAAYNDAYERGLKWLNNGIDLCLEQLNKHTEQRDRFVARYQNSLLTQS